MFRKMPFILIVTIVAIILFNRFLPSEVKSILYSISLTVKSVIVFLLPVIIFGLLLQTSMSLSSNATKIILFILVGVCCSNFISTFLSHFVGEWAYGLDLSIDLPKDSQGLEPYWTFELPRLIANDKAMFAGLILGCAGSLLKLNAMSVLAQQLERIVSRILNIFTYVIPFFVAGFVIKLESDGVMINIIKNYSVIFAVVAAAQFSYIFLIYFVVNGFSLKDTFASIKNMIPAAITGFSTMSSATSMPLTMIGAEKNASNPSLARSVIPATVSIHLIGDCFAIPIFAYAVLKNYGLAEPTLISYLIFTFYFVLAKFSVAAIPGGGIIVMLPILESYLGFTAPMMSLITALYILFDPVITCANILGNGGFAMIVDRLQGLGKEKQIA